MKTIAVALLCAFLAACAGTPAVQIPREVKVPVPVACVDPADVPKAPRVPTEAELLAMNQYHRTLAVWIAYVELSIYQLQLQAIVERCSRVLAPRLNAAIRDKAGSIPEKTQKRGVIF